MKTLLLFPPTIQPSSFYLSLPLLVTQLQNSGFDASGIDLNVEFYNDILNKEYVLNTKIILENMVKKPDDISLEKLQKIRKDLADTENIQAIIEHIDNAVMVFKTEEYFYKPKLLEKANYIVKKALEFISLPYYPTEILYNKVNYNFGLDFKNIKEYCFDKSTNIFIGYFEKKIEEAVDKNTELIGISVPFDYHICNALTLAKLLKEKTNAHITLGGATFTHNKDSILKHPEIFDIFCDSIQTGEGEHSIIELANYIKNKTNISEVSGLICKNIDNEIIVNPVRPIINMNNVPKISLTDIDFKKYFTPEFTMPFIFSKGCYWGKCVFCGNSYSKPVYCTKKPEEVASEIQELYEKYKIKYFSFYDDSISPIFYERLADEIIKRNLNIKYGSYGRLEKDFTKKLLKKLYKSGLRVVFWGLDSASEKVNKLMNKGIDIKQAGKILKDSHNVGIWNHVAIIVGFPSESKEDFRETYNFCKENIKYIDSSFVAKFELIKHSPANKIQNELGIETIKSEDFSCVKEYYDAKNTKKEKEIRLNTLNSLLSKYHSVNTLYLFRYGRNWLLRGKKTKEIIIV